MLTPKTTLISTFLRSVRAPPLGSRAASPTAPSNSCCGPEVKYSGILPNPWLSEVRTTRYIAAIVPDIAQARRQGLEAGILLRQGPSGLKFTFQLF